VWKKARGGLNDNVKAGRRTMCYLCVYVTRSDSWLDFTSLIDLNKLRGYENTQNILSVKPLSNAGKKRGVQHCCGQ
jgi:hypothetical protein